MEKQGEKRQNDENGDGGPFAFKVLLDVLVVKQEREGVKFGVQGGGMTVLRFVGQDLMENQNKI